MRRSQTGLGNRRVIFIFPVRRLGSELSAAAKDAAFESPCELAQGDLRITLGDRVLQKPTNLDHLVFGFTWSVIPILSSARRAASQTLP